jgi:hypothetical protein
VFEHFLVSCSYPTSLAGPVIQVRVGAEDDAGAPTFSVHQELFTKRSEFFKLATSGSWRESKENTISFPEDDLDAFRVYLHLVYTNNVVSSGTMKNEWMLLCRLYVLAEKLQDAAAKDSAIDAMRDYAKDARRMDTMVWDPEVIRELYDGTPERSPARRLVVDLYALLGGQPWLEGKKAELPKDFLYDIAMRMIQTLAPVRNQYGATPALESEYRDETVCKTKPSNVTATSSMSMGAFGSTSQPKSRGPTYANTKTGLFGRSVVN